MIRKDSLEENYRVLPEFRRQSSSGLPSIPVPSPTSPLSAASPSELQLPNPLEPVSVAPAETPVGLSKLELNDGALIDSELKAVGVLSGKDERESKVSLESKSDLIGVELKEVSESKISPKLRSKAETLDLKEADLGFVCPSSAVYEEAYNMHSGEAPLSYIIASAYINSNASTLSSSSSSSMEVKQTPISVDSEGCVPIKESPSEAEKVAAEEGSMTSKLLQKISTWLRKSEGVTDLIQEFIEEFGLGLISGLTFDMVSNKVIQVLETLFFEHLVSNSFHWIQQLTKALHAPPENRASLLARVSDNFTSTATQYATTIISEISLPDELKTIKPISIGGIAGGQKFIVNSILFKLALDVNKNSGRSKNPFYIYGGKEASHELAMKAAANELVGANQYSHVLPKNIIVPMQCVIDFKGFRIVAMPVLPILKETLVYGSGDAGKTVHNDVPEVSAAMKEAARILHLAEHPIMDKSNEKHVFLCSAGDVEVHRSKDDTNEFFLLDLARAMPPEDPSKTVHLIDRGNTVFYRMFRPEFLRYLKEKGFPAVSSDSFSGWGTIDREKLNPIATKATKILMTDVIPLLVDRLKKTPADVLRNSNLSRVFHSVGVNMRHLLAVCKHCREKDFEHVRERLILEAMVRTFKNMIRLELRSIATSKKKTDYSKASYCVDFSIWEYKQAICKFFNQFFFLIQPKSVQDSNIELLSLEILKRFGTMDGDTFEFKRTLQKILQKNFAQIIISVFQRVGIVLLSTSFKQLEALQNLSLDDPVLKDGVLLVESDIKEFSFSLKKMSIFDTSSAEIVISTYDKTFDTTRGLGGQLLYLGEQVRISKSLSSTVINRLRDLAVDIIQRILANDPSNDRAYQLVVEQIGSSAEEKIGDQEQAETLFLTGFTEAALNSGSTKVVCQREICRFLDYLVDRIPRLAQNRNFNALISLVIDYWCFDIFISFGAFLLKVLVDSKQLTIVPTKHLDSFKALVESLKDSILSEWERSEEKKISILFAYVGFFETDCDTSFLRDLLLDDEMSENPLIRFLTSIFLFRNNTFEDFFQACYRFQALTWDDLKYFLEFSILIGLMKHVNLIMTIVLGRVLRFTKTAHELCLYPNVLGLHPFEDLDNDASEFLFSARYLIYTILNKLIEFMRLRHPAATDTEFDGQFVFLSKSRATHSFWSVQNNKIIVVMSPRIKKNSLMLGLGKGRFLEILIGDKCFMKVKGISFESSADLQASFMERGDSFMKELDLQNLLHYYHLTPLHKRVRLEFSSLAVFIKRMYHFEIIESCEELFGPEGSDRRLDFLFEEGDADEKEIDIRKYSKKKRVFVPGFLPFRFGFRERGFLDYSECLDRQLLEDLIVEISSLQMAEWTHSSTSSLIRETPTSKSSKENLFFRTSKKLVHGIKATLRIPTRETLGNIDEEKITSCLISYAHSHGRVVSLIDFRLEDGSLKFVETELIKVTFTSIKPDFSIDLSKATEPDILYLFSTKQLHPGDDLLRPAIVQAIKTKNLQLIKFFLQKKVPFGFEWEGRHIVDLAAAYGGSLVWKEIVDALGDIYSVKRHYQIAREHGETEIAASLLEKLNLSEEARSTLIQKERFVSSFI